MRALSRPSSALSFALAVALVAGACGGEDPIGASDPAPSAAGEIAATPFATSSPTPSSSTTSDDTSPAGGEPTVDAPAPTQTEAPTTDPGPPAAADVTVPADLKLQLTPIVSLERPIDLAVRPGSPNLWVATKDGRVVEVRVDGDEGTVVRQVLDIGDAITDGSETGLLGIAFSPDGERLYLSYSDRNGHSQLVELTVDDGELDLDNGRSVLSVEQPRANHNGGDLAFGPDGLLYVALGDGGGGGDPDGNGQNPDTLLGSILRIDPSGDPYSIPADNPFADGGGRPETFLYGVRNPWRISFDRGTGDLWVADVGQGAVEEVDVLYASEGGGRGANLGWNKVEGNLAFSASSPPEGGYVAPILQYGREDGCSITGGYVYRGEAIAELTGSYIFGDYCSGRMWGLASSEQQGLVGRFDLDVSLGDKGLVSFGEDARGELYVLSFDNTLYRIDPA